MIPAQYVIVGTAGHIDHGKTSLVRALTGVDTDQLKEEKERGITIDLGFASSTFPNDITLSWIDVPGHERFIGNMLAGAAGIDMVVLVVAATEGVMPQTREHFEICRMLGVRRGLVALTKSDLVDADGLELAEADVRALVSGSFLEGAPVVAVSSRTGAGLDRLRAALLSIAQELENRGVSGNFRLPIDRAFVMKGFGPVVTGTVFNGRVGLEQSLVLLPSGQPVRVRGIQVHGRPAPEAQRGQRVALNLAGIDAAEVHRGDSVTEPGAYRPTREFDVQLELLPAAPDLPPLHPVHFHMATSATVAKMRYHGQAGGVAPGSRVFARVYTEAPLIALPGDHFILRRFSPLETIGGGIILDNHPPRLRRKQSQTERLHALATGEPKNRLLAAVSDCEAGCALTSLVPRLGLREPDLRSLVGRSGLRVIGPQGDWLLTLQQSEALAARLQSILAAFHADNPILPGMGKEPLRAALDARWPSTVFDAFIEQDSRFHRNGDIVRLSVHQPTLSQAEAQASRTLENLFLSAGLEAPAVADALRESGIDSKIALTILQGLLREGRLVKVGQDLIFHKRNIATAVELVQKHRGQPFTVAEFKEWTGVSRKYAIPLLEFLDRQRITRRTGNSRLVL